MHSSYACNRKNSPTVVKIEKDDPEFYNDPSVWILHVDRHFIEVFYTSYEIDVATWVTKTLHKLRYLRRRDGPLVLSLCAFKGYDYRVPWRERRKGPKANPNHPSNPYRAIGICVGRSHVLIYRHEDHYWYGKDFLIKPFEDLLENTRVVVVGLGIKEITEKLHSQWGFRIARPVELRKLMKCAYGKDSMSWPKQDLENGGSVIDGLGLEQMAELALDGMRMEKKPTKVLEADWGEDIMFDDDYDDWEIERLKYASRDAFLTYEIATKCLKKTGMSWKDAYLHC